MTCELTSCVHLVVYRKIERNSEFSLGSYEFLVPVEHPV